MTTASSRGRELDRKVLTPRSMRTETTWHQDGDCCPLDYAWVTLTRISELNAGSEQPLAPVVIAPQGA